MSWASNSANWRSLIRLVFGSSWKYRSASAPSRTSCTSCCLRKRKLLASVPMPLRLPRPVCDVELDAGLFLQVADDAEEVAGLRIAAWAEHADEALRLRAGRLAKLLEAVPSP